MRALLALLLVTSAVSAAEHAHDEHGWCGKLEDGKGLLMERTQTLDRWCGWITPPNDGEYVFASNVAGTNVAINKSLTRGPLPMKKGELYAIVIEAPKSDNFKLVYATKEVRYTEVPISMLYPPSLTVKPGCEVIS